jgi:hypothetical protein
VNIYSGFEASKGGTPYSGLVGTLTASGVTFATDNAYAWHPFGLDRFGADITGPLDVLVNGTYTFSLDSDDGALLFIDGSLVVDNGGAHSPTIGTGSATLTAGSHPFEVQFFEDFGGPSGVDLVLPTGVSYACPPQSCTEPPVASCAVVKAPALFANPPRLVGWFQLLATDNCDPDPLIYIKGSVGSFVAGPFHNGDQVEIAHGPRLIPRQAPSTSGGNIASIQLNGDALLWAVDSAGNASTPVKCK